MNNTEQQLKRIIKAAYTCKGNDRSAALMRILDRLYVIVGEK